MVVAPRDFLDHANKLLDINQNPNPSEIDCRSAISRAYYSLFHETADFLHSKGRFTRTGKPGEHTKIKNILEDIDPMVALEYGDYKVARQEADYELSITVFNLSYATTKVKHIESFIYVVKNLPI
jgi:uncharacterized protein (UPF0332 family)